MHEGFSKIFFFCYTVGGAMLFRKVGSDYENLKIASPQLDTVVAKERLLKKELE